MLLPRLLAVILLLVSLAMLVPIGSAVVDLSEGTAVRTTAWLYPLIILGTGAVMTWLLTRKNVSLHLYLAAFALWVVTAGYFWLTR